MGVVLSIDKPTIGIWNLEEHEIIYYFLDQFPWTNEETVALDKVSHPAKRLQKMAARACFKKLMPDFQQFPILNDGEGRPYLLNANQGMLSLSHSDSLAGFIYSDEHIVSLDIERIDPTRSLKVAKMFMNESELKQLSQLNDIRYFYLLWCIKECLFKILNYAVKEISFQRQLYTLTTNRIFTVQEQGEVVVGCNRIDIPFEGIAHYQIWNDYMIAYISTEKSIGTKLS